MSTAIALPVGVATPDRPKKGWIAYGTLIVAFLTAAPLWIGYLADSARPLGLDPRFYVNATAAVLITGILLRGFIAAVGTYKAGLTSTTSGFSTYVGVAGIILAGIPAILQDLAGAAGPLHVDPVVWTKAAVYLSIATGAMKGMQAVATTLNTWNPDGTINVPAPTGSVPLPPVEQPPVTSPPWYPVTPSPADPPVDPPVPPDQGDAGPGGFPQG